MVAVAVPERNVQKKAGRAGGIVELDGQVANQLSQTLKEADQNLDLSEQTLNAFEKLENILNAESQQSNGDKVYVNRGVLNQVLNQLKETDDSADLPMQLLCVLETLEEALQESGPSEQPPAEVLQASSKLESRAANLCDMQKSLESQARNLNSETLLSQQDIQMLEQVKNSQNIQDLQNQKFDFSKFQAVLNKLKLYSTISQSQQQ